MKIRIIAIKTLKPEFMRGSKSLSPENESGPTKTTIKPPPTKIKIHITKMKENIARDIR
jgi:hypothetical protein